MFMRSKFRASGQANENREYHRWGNEEKYWEGGEPAESIIYTHWMLSQIIFIQHSEINTNMTLRQLCVWNDHLSEWWRKRQNYLLFANIKLSHKILQQKCNFISSLLLFHKMLLYWNLNLVIVDFLSFTGTHWMHKCCISFLQYTW